MTASGYLESLPDDRLVGLWTRRSSPAGALDRVSVALRRELIDRGLWRVVYGMPAESPCERCVDSAGLPGRDAGESG